MSGRRCTRTAHDHAPDPVDAGRICKVRPARVEDDRDSSRGREAAPGRRAAVAGALVILSLVAGLGLSGAVLGARWLWRSYHDLAIASGLLVVLALGLWLLARSIRVVAVHYGVSRRDTVSPETLDRLRREETR